MKTFKVLFLLIGAILMTQSCVASHRPNMEFFSNSDYDYKGARFVSFNVPVFLAKPFIKKALREDKDGEAVYQMVKKVSKIKILTVENGNKAMLNDYANYLNDNSYEDWATIKHDGNNVNIRVKQKGESIRNMLITVNSDKDLVFVDVKGNFTPDDISRMITSVSDK